MGSVAVREVQQGKYEQIRDLGRGSCGAVWLVRRPPAFARGEAAAGRFSLVPKDAVPGRHLLAMKVALPAPPAEGDLVGELSFRAIVEREGRCLKRLSEEGIPGIPSFHEFVHGEDGEICGYVMEYIRGKSLREYLRNKKRLPRGEAVGITVGVCRVLTAMHSMEPPVCYLDLKPENIILAPGKGPVLIDFGAARSGGETEADASLGLLGTFGYAPTEQCREGYIPSGQADVYGAGAILHEMLSGQSPSRTGLLPIGTCDPSLKGSELERILTACCNPAPQLRYDSCEALAAALRRAEESEGDAGLLKRVRLTRGMGRVLAVCLTAAACLDAFAQAADEACYEALLADAAGEERWESKAEDYVRAWSMMPEDPRGPIALLLDLAGDGRVTAREDRMADDLLQSPVPASGTAGREESREGVTAVLRANNPDGCASFMAARGCVDWACYEGGREKAAEEIRAALKAGYLGEDLRETLSRLLAVSEPWDDSALTGRWEAWEMLCAAISEERLPAAEQSSARGRPMKVRAENDLTGDMWFQAAVYRGAAAEISLHAEDYERQGISDQRMREVLLAGEAFVSEVCGGAVDSGEALGSGGALSKDRVPAEILDGLETELDNAGRTITDVSGAAGRGADKD